MRPGSDRRCIQGPSNECRAVRQSSRAALTLMNATLTQKSGVSDPSRRLGRLPLTRERVKFRKSEWTGIVFGLQANLVNCRRYFPLWRRSTSFPFAYLWTRLEISV